MQPQSLVLVPWVPTQESTPQARSDFRTSQQLGVKDTRVTKADPGPPWRLFQPGVVVQMTSWETTGQSSLSQSVRVHSNASASDTASEFLCEPWRKQDFPKLGSRRGSR